jgi:hypothetical protein
MGMGAGMRKRVRIGLIVAIIALIFAFVVDAEDTVNVSNIDTVNTVDTVSNVNIANDADTVNIVDTINNVNIANVVDTVGNVNTVNYVDTAINKRPPPPMISNDPPQLSGAYWGFGLGLSLGTVPVFPLWQKNFPDSLSRIGLSPAFAADAEKGDTALLRYRVIESPDKFNNTAPFHLSLYSINEKQIFSLTLSFFRNSKEFQSELSVNSDDAVRRISVLERLVYYSLSMEAAGRWFLPQAFFSIDGWQQTLITLAAGASPVNFVRESEIKTNLNSDDARMRLVADSAKKTFAALSGNGLSLSWRAGMSATYRYPSGYGLEFGVFYCGAYTSHFYSDGVRLTEAHFKTRGTDLNAESVVNGKPLSFISSQAEFRAILLVPTKKSQKDI